MDTGCNYSNACSTYLVTVVVCFSNLCTRVARRKHSVTLCSLSRKKPVYHIKYVLDATVTVSILPLETSEAIALTKIVR